MIEGAFTLSLQGLLEQEGAYRQAEQRTVEQVFVPFFNEHYPEHPGILTLVYGSYEV